jgi:hypothetical protein
MTEDRIDFSPLDPMRDAERFEEIVRSITAAAAGELAARRARGSVVGQVALWWGPLLAAAAITGIVSLTALARLQTTAPTETTEPGLAEAIGVPTQVAEWVRGDELPTPTELLVTLESEQ